MALLENCPTCGNGTSENASICPACGEPLQDGWINIVQEDRQHKIDEKKAKYKIWNILFTDYTTGDKANLFIFYGIIMFLIFGTYFNTWLEDSWFPNFDYSKGVNIYDTGVFNGYDLNVSDKENLESQYERLLFWEPLDETPTRNNILFNHREINAGIAKKIELLAIKLYDDSHITNYQRFENSNHNLFYYFSKFYIFMGEIFFMTKESITILQLCLFNGILFLLLPFPLYLKIRFVIELKAEEISNAIKQKVNLIWNKYF